MAKQKGKTAPPELIVSVRWIEEFQRWEATCDGLDLLGTGWKASLALCNLGTEIIRQADSIDRSLRWYEEGRPQKVKELRRQRKLLLRMNEEVEE